MFSAEFMKDIFEKYQEPHRHWHNWNHIKSMFRNSVIYFPKITLSQQLAILYHDVIYVPSSKTNEEDSANFAISHMTTFKSELINLLKKEKSYNSVEECNTDFESLLTVVPKIILDTKHHKPSINESKIVLDLDMAIISDSYEAVLKYDNAIEKEFCTIYTKLDFYKGRLDFLKTLVKAKSFYYTKEFKTLQFEEKARQNLNYLILIYQNKLNN